MAQIGVETGSQLQNTLNKSVAVEAGWFICPNFHLGLVWNLGRVWFTADLNCKRCESYWVDLTFSKFSTAKFFQTLLNCNTWLTTCLIASLVICIIVCYSPILNRI